MGWLGAERYIAMFSIEPHDFEQLFEENPHPEIFDKDGNLDRGEYITLNFELGYDPSEFNSEDITEE